MRFAVTTRTITFSNPRTRTLVKLPAGRPVVIEGWDGEGPDRTYIIETEDGEVNEAVPGDALDFDADF